MGLIFLYVNPPNTVHHFYSFVPVQTSGHRISKVKRIWTGTILCKDSGEVVWPRSKAYLLFDNALVDVVEVLEESENFWIQSKVLFIWNPLGKGGERDPYTSETYEKNFIDL